MSFLDLPALLLAYAAAAVLLAAFVRGFAGFGSSLLWVASLTLVLPPAEVVPMVLLFEVAASAGLLPSVWRQVHWGSLFWIVLGTALATPFGVYLLVALPVDLIRALIALAVLSAALLIWQGRRLRAFAGPGPALTTGVGAGLLNGAAGIGGPPVILFYFGSSTAIGVGRASIIAYFLASDAFGTSMMATQGLLTAPVLWRTAFFLPVVGLGIWAGNRRFLATAPESFRLAVLALMALLGAALLARSLIGSGSPLV
ncbi:MAG: sulfite exporter TauE/SafE family protein [Alphaproteobacteria bacterium]|nr:sulfite exporter TauE/SafE family protein [Alphaproteobacteria bacterium]